MRQVLAVIAGASVAAFGGLILGEYQFTGLMPYATGLLFALVVGEVILSIGGQPGVTSSVAAAFCTIGGLGWAIWISTGQGLAPIPPGAWVALGIGTVAALLRGGIRAGLAPGGRSRPSA